MKNVIAGQNTALAAAQALVPYRRAIMDMLVGHPLITTAEYETAMQRTQACQDLATLQRWYRNTVREIAAREEATGMKNGQPAQYATAAQASEIHTLALHRAITDGERTQAMLKLPTLDYQGATALIGALWGRIVLRTQKGQVSTVSAC